MLTLKKILKISLILSLFINTGCDSKKEQKSNGKESSQQKPNILFILIDDMGQKQLGCYGSDYYQTPNVDKLYKQGMHFTQAYSGAAICSPTRSSIMTGKHPARLHITDFIPGNKFPRARLKQPDWQKFLPLNEKTIAEALKKRGYTTAIYGKWHLSTHKKPPESLSHNPDKQGFDDHLVTYKPEYGLDERPEDAHNVDTITKRGLQFLEKHKDEPFFLMLSHNTIHDPLYGKDSLVKKYRAMKASSKDENNPRIAAMIETMDNSVGKMLKKVKNLGLKENTIVIFYSDNGGKEEHADQTPLREGKGWVYEGGIRVPLIVRWPGKVKPGSETNELMTSHDLFPTFMDMTGKKISADSLEGVNLMPVLTQNKSLERNTLYWHYPHYHWGSKMKPAGAIRHKNYKLIEWYEKTVQDQEKGRYELYNLKKDLSESNNLAEKQPEKVKKLGNMLKSWRDSINAQMPPGLNKDYVPGETFKMPWDIKDEEDDG